MLSYVTYEKFKHETVERSNVQWDWWREAI